MPDPGYFVKLRKFLLVGCHRLRTRRHRRRSRRSVSSARSSTLFSLEPLEPRVLLAADLTGLVNAHTLQDPSVPTNAESATVQVQNIGNQRANSTTQVAVYASLDSTFDASDVLLGTANT